MRKSHAASVITRQQVVPARADDSAVMPEERPRADAGIVEVPAIRLASMSYIYTPPQYDLDPKRRFPVL